VKRGKAIALRGNDEGKMSDNEKKSIVDYNDTFSTTGHRSYERQDSAR